MFLQIQKFSCLCYNLESYLFKCVYLAHCTPSPLVQSSLEIMRRDTLSWVPISDRNLIFLLSFILLEFSQLLYFAIFLLTCLFSLYGSSVMRPRCLSLTYISWILCSEFLFLCVSVLTISIELSSSDLNLSSGLYFAEHPMI